MRTNKTNGGGNGNNGGQAEAGFFWVKGDANVVDRALQTFQATFGGGAHLARATLSPVALPKPAAAALSAAQVPADDEDDRVVDARLATPEPSAVSERQPRKARSYAIPDLLDELKAHEDPDSFKSYVGTRTITSDIDRGLTVAMWLKHKRSVVEFGTNHVHTCFEMIPGWKLPEDPSSLLRNMKKSQYVRPIAGKTGVFELTSKGANKYAEVVA